MPITSIEVQLKKTFAERPNRILRRDQLLERVHAKDMVPFDRSIDTRIDRIQRKIEPIPKKPECIGTVQGLGYLYNPDSRRS